MAYYLEDLLDMGDFFVLENKDKDDRAFAQWELMDSHMKLNRLEDQW